MQIIAHRGAHRDPSEENTPSAFTRAIGLGFSMMELDIRLTKDDYLIVHHDPEILHEGRKVLIRTHLFRDLLEAGNCTSDPVRFGQSRKYPTLELVLDVCLPQIRINVELKEKGSGKVFADLLTKMSGFYKTFQSGEILKSLLVSSFEDSEIRAVKKTFPQIETALLMKNFEFPLLKINSKKLAYLKQMGIEGVHIPRQRTNKEVVHYLKSEYGFKVRVYTVNDHTSLYHCRDCQADAVFTDKPELFNLGKTKPLYQQSVSA